MSNLIRFLEKMGNKPLSAIEYAASVEALEVDALQQKMLLDRDQVALSDALGGRASMCCLILAAEEEVE